MSHQLPPSPTTSRVRRQTERSPVRRLTSLGAAPVAQDGVWICIQCCTDCEADRETKGGMQKEVQGRQREQESARPRIATRAWPGFLLLLVDWRVYEAH